MRGIAGILSAVILSLQCLVMPAQAAEWICPEEPVMATGSSQIMNQPEQDNGSSLGGPQVMAPSVLLMEASTGQVHF